MRLVSNAAVAALFLPAALSAAQDPGIEFVGLGFVPGYDLDRSKASGTTCSADDASNCIDNRTLGAFGSCLAYTGHDNVFVAVNDRGPFDGRTNVPYDDRIQFFLFELNTSAAFPNITTSLLATRFLRNEAGTRFVGSSSAFDLVDPLATLRLDPEGVRISREGTCFISDEYGPYLFEFDRQGNILRRLAIPAKFLIANPSGAVDSSGTSLELYPANNSSGRQANRGMEGLAITPDGSRLVGIMQSALIQDNGLNSNTPPGRVGLNNRILTYDLATNETHEYVYTLDGINQGRGVNEILAINNDEFLVLERDNRSMLPTPPGAAQLPNLKRIYKISLVTGGPTDVSNVASLPATGSQLAPAGIVPVTKTLFLDLLSPAYQVSSTQTIRDVIAEKPEGLAWGPDLPDGRHVLYVITDNDLYPGLPTQIYAFAVDAAAAGIDFEPQVLPGPFFPPGQVRR
jgi:hypothetical protein